MLPFSVYFTALFKRFTRICRIRNSSPIISFGTFSAICVFRTSDFSSALSLIREITSHNKSSRRKSSSLISIFPDSILVKSSTSFTSIRSIFPDVLMFLEYSSMTESLFSLRIISFIPRMELIGVRISWDMLARNFVFASEISMACCFSAFSIRKS